jgi:transposase
LAGAIDGIATKNPQIHGLSRFQTTSGCQEVHVVLDNYGTHKTPKVIRWFARHPRYHLHFTPTSGSWINQVERWFGKLTEKRIRRGSFLSVASLEKAIQEYLDHYNENPKPFVWTADADLILGKIQRLYE